MSKSKKPKPIPIPERLWMIWRRDISDWEGIFTCGGHAWFSREAARIWCHSGDVAVRVK